MTCQHKFVRTIPSCLQIPSAKRCSALIERNEGNGILGNIAYYLISVFAVLFCIDTSPISHGKRILLAKKVKAMGERRQYVRDLARLWECGPLANYKATASPSRRHAQ